METKIGKDRKQKAEQARKIIRKLQWQMDMMMCISHTGFMMDNETFRLMLKNNPHIEKVWQTLNDRKFKVERILWKTA